MIVHLPDTTTSQISKKLVTMREAGGEVTTGRVLSLIIVASCSDSVEDVIAAANDASREHPARVLVLLTANESKVPEGGIRDEANGRLDAEIRVGGDAGASEVIVMRLYGAVAKHLESVVTPLLLPDTPIVAWWPATPPPMPAQDPIGRIASRRITDSFADPQTDAIFTRRTTYTPGDTDLAWSRITQWRGILASALDQPPFDPIEGATVTGPANDPSVDMAAGWLADRLGMNVVRQSSSSTKIPLDDRGRPCIGIEKIELHRPCGDIVMETVSAHTVQITREGGEHENLVALSRRSIQDCLAEELRHLDPDIVFAKALRGLSRVRRTDAYVF